MIDHWKFFIYIKPEIDQLILNVILPGVQGFLHTLRYVIEILNLLKRALTSQ